MGNCAHGIFIWSRTVSGSTTSTLCTGARPEPTFDQCMSLAAQWVRKAVLTEVDAETPSAERVMAGVKCIAEIRRAVQAPQG